MVNFNYVSSRIPSYWEGGTRTHILTIFLSTFSPPKWIQSKLYEADNQRVNSRPHTKKQTNMPYSYTNRQGKTYYFRAAQTKKGGTRYYVTTSPDFPDLVEEVPRGFEVMEQPDEARVIIRKIKPLLVTQEEKEIVHDAIEEFSALTDFFIHAEERTISVYHSQFNYPGGQDANLTREEAKELFSPEIGKWMRFLTSMHFILVDDVKRLFQTERKVFLSFFGHDFHPVGEPGQIEDVAREHGQHLGRDSYFDIVPNGMEE